MARSAAELLAEWHRAAMLSLLLLAAFFGSAQSHPGCEDCTGSKRNVPQDKIRLNGATPTASDPGQDDSGWHASVVYYIGVGVFLLAATAIHVLLCLTRRRRVKLRVEPEGPPTPPPTYGETTFGPPPPYTPPPEYSLTLNDLRQAIPPQ